MNKRLPWWGAAAAALTFALVAVAAGAQAADETPYFMLADPLPANPATFPWRIVALSGGPVGAEISSNEWTVGDVAGFVSNLAAGRDPWRGLPPEAVTTESLAWAGGGRAQVNIAAFQLSYGLLTNGGGWLPKGFVSLMRDASNGTPSGTYKLDGTTLRGQVWQDLAVRANAPVPLIPRFLGLQKLSVGAGVHFLSGVQYFGIGASGTLDTASPSPGAEITLVKASQAQGRAFDVGLVASLNRRLSVEAAYLGAGSLTWNGVQVATITSSNVNNLNSPLWTDAPSPLTYDLPAVALVGVHLRPLPVGLLELSGYYARVGVNHPDTAFDRLQGEVSLSALGLLRASLGAAVDSGEPQARWYGSVGVGLGAAGLTVRATDLQEIARGTGAKSLGVAVMASLGF